MHISILSCWLVQHLSSRFRTSRKDSRQAGMTDNVVLLMNSLVKEGDMRILKISMVVLMLLLSMVFAGSIFAVEPKVSGTASVDVMSNYVWRGQKLTNSWVIQPYVGITYGSFGANIWANYDSDSKIDEGGGHGEVSETDLTLSYSFSVEKWNFR